jgi:hypothetical protein
VALASSGYLNGHHQDSSHKHRQSPRRPRDKPSGHRTRKKSASRAPAELTCQPGGRQSFYVRLSSRPSFSPFHRRHSSLLPAAAAAVSHAECQWLWPRGGEEVNGRGGGQLICGVAGSFVCLLAGWHWHRHSREIGKEEGRDHSLCCCRPAAIASYLFAISDSMTIKYNTSQFIEAN